MTEIAGHERFIVFEGIDGAGTTTQTARLRSWLEARGEKVVTTCEPSEGPFGSMVRNALKRRIVVPTTGEGPDADVDPRVVALLFAADRLDHLDATILPALARGWWVISDRYIDSSLAYQSIYMDLDWVRTINAHAQRPARTFFLEVPPAEGMARIRAKRARRDHFETEQRLQQVDLRYREIYAAAPPDLVRLDGTQPEDEIAAEIASYFEGSVG
ncbi:MAG: dTMP kinase [Pseudomonadota bacterium]